MTKICFIVPYPTGLAPSQRFRFEQYFNLLASKGYRFKVFPFLNPRMNGMLYQSRFLPGLAIALLVGFVRRVIHLFSAINAHYIFIHREAMPVGPPVFEWICAKPMRKRIIYDFDDAIWLTDREESKTTKLLRWRGKVRPICRWSYRISCGNNYLAAFARSFNANVVVNPTTIDTENLHNPEIIKVSKDPSRVIIGWTGSYSTLKYLQQLVPVLQHLEQEFPQVAFRVIADRNPELPLQRYAFVPWNKTTEAKDLAILDIGVMPLPDDAWTRGKCGFKALQYMAMEIPCVVSPVGVNIEIVQHGVNGFWAATAHEWQLYLSQLIQDENLRLQMGKSGRQTVLQRYSVRSNAPLFLSLFDKATM